MSFGRLVLSVFIVLQVADGLITYAAVSIFGTAAEGNPIDPDLDALERIVRIKAVPRARVYGRPLIGRRSPSPTAAGIYALMSFTVAQRTREIGIRTALGAPPRRLVLTVCGRATWQVAVGVAVGSVLSAGAFMAIGVGVLRATPLLLAVAAIMAVVALLATLGPARRGVRIPAMEALRADA